MILLAVWRESTCTGNSKRLAVRGAVPDVVVAAAMTHETTSGFTQLLSDKLTESSHGYALKRACVSAYAVTSIGAFVFGPTCKK
jgi:hypothetical protein